MSNKYQKHKVVVLGSGGPDMTIREVLEPSDERSEDSDSYFYRVQWIDSNKKLQESTFPEGMLKPSDEVEYYDPPLPIFIQ